ncbi:MAG: hypothetical protein SFX19_09325 [Alphaproteobacteria bacterium]|nr:hypothetical protein [Alphaproteobacteria bacterium]
MEHVEAALKKAPKLAVKLAEELLGEENLKTLRNPRTIPHMSPAATSYFTQTLFAHVSEIGLTKVEWEALAHELLKHGMRVSEPDIIQLLEATEHGRELLANEMKYLKPESLNKLVADGMGATPHSGDKPTIRYNPSYEGVEHALYVMRHPDDHQHVPAYAEVHGRHHHHR